MIRAYKQIYSFRIDIREDQLTPEGIIAIIQEFDQQTLLRPRYLLMNELDIAAVATRYIPHIPSKIAGVSLVELPGLERGIVIAGFFGD